MKLAVVVLAVGKGTRMLSRLPKVLHGLAGRSLVEYSIDLAYRLSPEPPVLIVRHGSEKVRAKVGARARFVEQAEQLGSGHAVLQAEQVLADRADIVLVYAADMPLLTTDTLRRLVAVHGKHRGPITLLTVLADDPRGFGRIMRGSEDEVLGVVEEVEATPEQKAIRELNAGVYCFDAVWLWPALKRLTPSPAKGDLTDALSLAVSEGYQVHAVTTEDRSETMGVNTRVHLAEAEQVLRRRINGELMMGGVTMIDPESTYVQPGVQIGRDCTLWPGVHMLGETSVGKGCEIGPGAVLTDVQLGDDCQVGAHAVLTGVVATAGAVFPAGVVESIQRE